MTLIPFPRPDMDFGGQADVSDTENESFCLSILKNIGRWRNPPYWFPKVSDGEKRELSDRNRLGKGEKHLESIEDPKSFWLEVLKLAPPKPWTDKAKTLAFLSVQKPMDIPSTSKFWATANNWLDEVIRQGSEKEWRDDMTIDVPRISAELWDVIRIIGDSTEGFGTYPKCLKARMSKAGFLWIGVDPKKRIIPKCWVKWAKANKMVYKSAVTGMGNPIRTLSTSQQTSSMSEMSLGPESQMSQLQAAKRQPGLLLPEQRAQKALEDLQEYRGQPYRTHKTPFAIQQPEESVRCSRGWQAVESNLNDMNQQMVQLQDTIRVETEELITQSMRDAVVGGAIEGKIQQMLDQAIDCVQYTIQKTSAAHDKEIRELRTEIAGLKEQARHGGHKRRKDSVTLMNGEEEPEDVEAEGRQKTGAKRKRKG